MVPDLRLSLENAVRYAKKALRAEANFPSATNPPGWASAILQDLLEAVTHAERCIAHETHPQPLEEQK